VAGGVHDLTPGARISLNTPYQGVLLTNGQVFYRRLDKLGSPVPVLTEVYYVQSQVNQDTKQMSNTLIRRGKGKEWHGPDRMILNGPTSSWSSPCARTRLSPSS